MEVRRIDPGDAAAFDAWYAVLWATDFEHWPDLGGWTRREAHALVSSGLAAFEYRCLSAIDATGATIGIALCEVPRRENQHSMSLDVRVGREYRRRGVGTAIVAEVERRASADGRSVLNGLFEVPTAMLASDGAGAFARRMGFAATQTGNRRHLTLPLDAERRALLADELAKATVGYRMHTFMAPWPKEYLADQCELGRRMSTDAPSGDERHEEEVWDAARVEEMDRQLSAAGMRKLVAVAEHVQSGRLVAFSEVALPQDHPHEGWQWATLVLREHRGHRLGLAVKLANLDALASTLPAVTLISTGNAQENTPMIAVNDLLGFVVVATGTFWQKELVLSP
jgi:GNAT superfamily N-acetyltransferase